MDAIGMPEMLPGLICGEGEDRGEESAEGLRDLPDGSLGGATAWAVCGIAVHAVLGDVDVEGTEIPCDEAIDDAEDLAEVVVRVGIDAFLGHDVQTLKDPPIDDGVFRSAVFLRRIVQVP